MKASGFSLLLLAVLAIAAASEPVAAQGVARAVLFYSPTCPHCAQVIRDDLPGFFRDTGGMPRLLVNPDVPEDERAVVLLRNDSLEILMVRVTEPRGGALYQASTASHAVIPQRQGVPRLIIGRHVLVGDAEIPEELPGLVREAIAAGGIAWPDFGDEIEGYPPVIGAPVASVEPDSAIPDSEQAPPDVPTEAARDSAAGSPSGDPTPPAPAEVASQPAPVTPETPIATATSVAESPLPSPPESTASPLTEAVTDTATGAATDSAATMAAIAEATSHRPGMIENFTADLKGGTLAVVVLVGMAAALILGIRSPRSEEASALSAAVPVGAVLGLAVSGYLAYIETSGTLAVCGPVGDCNAVQQSEYATLFGVVPVALLGLVSYAVILGCWMAARNGQGRVRDMAVATVFLVALAGTVFSIYLTFLEPFVIGATCAWCLTSAVLISAVMVLSAPSGKAAIHTMTAGSR